MWYLIVGNGWSCSFTLYRNTDWVSVNNRCVCRCTDNENTPTWRCVCVCIIGWLPALTLAVLHEGQFDEFMFHEGSPHQLHEDQEPLCLIKFKLLSIISALSSVSYCLFYVSLRAVRDYVAVCVCTSMVSVCVSEGTHSKASSAQQPPHRRTDTQAGTNRWCVSPGNSRQTSTRVSRGSQPLLEYTSNHRRTGRETQAAAQREEVRIRVMWVKDEEDLGKAGRTTLACSFHMNLFRYMEEIRR